MSSLIASQAETGSVSATVIVAVAVEAVDSSTALDRGTGVVPLCRKTSPTAPNLSQACLYDRRQSNIKAFTQVLGCTWQY